MNISYYGGQSTIVPLPLNVFHKMAEWLQSKTNQGSIAACEAVISFFIQSCEVFEDASK
jgi:hypothetical protein